MNRPRSILNIATAISLVVLWVVILLTVMLGAAAYAGTGAATLVTKVVPTPKKVMVIVASLPCFWQTNDTPLFREFVLVDAAPGNQRLTNRIIVSPSLPAQFVRGAVSFPITNAVSALATWYADGYTKLIECLNPDGFVCQALITPNKTQKTFALTYCWPTNLVRVTNLDTNGNALGSTTVPCVLPPFKLSTTLTNQ